MFSNNDFAAQKTPFDLNRVVMHTNNQFTDHLKAIGQHEEGVTHCSVAHKEASATTLHSHYSIETSHPALQENLKAFLTKKDVAHEHNGDTIKVHTNALESANLTSKDEGDFLFALNKSLKAKQAAHKDESANNSSPRLAM